MAGLRLGALPPPVPGPPGSIYEAKMVARVNRDAG